MLVLLPGGRVKAPPNYDLGGQNLPTNLDNFTVTIDQDWCTEFMHSPLKTCHVILEQITPQEEEMLKGLCEWDSYWYKNPVTYWRVYGYFEFQIIMYLTEPRI